MRILITGATGFVGRALCLRLSRDGHRLVAWVRRPEQARCVLAADVELLDASSDPRDVALEREISRCDAIVHLAGEPVVGRRWNARRKQSLVDSRVASASRLVAALSRAERRPRTWIGASAVGYHGDRGDRALDEDSPPAHDFLGDLCQRWERASGAARAHGARVVLIRIGLVLGPQGGVLGAMERPFRLGLGGRLGSGRQFWPWIHIDDLLEMFVRALVDPTIDGAYHGTAPEPATQAEFTRTLGRVLRRPTWLPVPAFALRIGMGEAASALLASQRALPKRWLAAGFRFRFAELAKALEDCLGADRELSVSADTLPRDHDYLRDRRPTHVLERTTWLDAPRAEVALFFSRAENLGAMTPPDMPFRILTPTPIAMAAGTTIDYRISLAGLALRWRTRIERWSGADGFVDVQLRGPYRAWWHEHEFTEVGPSRTKMVDRVRFALPGGWLGRLCGFGLVAAKLRGIFGYRTRAMRWRFGVAPTPESQR